MDCELRETIGGLVFKNTNTEIRHLIVKFWLCPMLACPSAQIFKASLHPQNRGDNNSLFMVVFSAKRQNVLQSICTVMATGMLGRIQRDFGDAKS